MTDSVVMSNLVTTQFFKWTPMIKIVGLCFGTLICFLSAWYHRHVSVYLPFISETGAKIPEMFIFSLTLYFGATIGLAVMWFQNIVVKNRLLVQQVRLHKINDVSLVIGIISMIGLVGVAASPMSTVLIVHLVFAGSHFAFALLYVTIQTFVTYHIPDGNTVWNKIRIVLCVLLLLFLICLVVLFPLSHFKWHKVNHHPPAVKTPEDQFFEMVIASSALEWGVYSVFLTIIATFYFEFKNFNFVYGIMPVSKEKRDALVS